MKKSKAKKQSEESSNKDFYLIGGGPSVNQFDLEQLRGKNTIGCNEAFRLGPEICKNLIFSDNLWFIANIHAIEVEAERGMQVWSVCPTTENFVLPWLHQMTRVNSGLHRPPALGLNGSTGAAAINLAVNLGADRIFLIGYDLGADEQGRTHWHNSYQRPTSEESFARHRNGFEYIAKALSKFAPEVQVINLNPASKLEMFDKYTDK
jgi:hypothetical protein